MKFKKQLFFSALISVICGCVVIFTIQLAAAKQQYYAQIKAKIEHLLDQQQTLLQRLGKQLISTIQQQDFVGISRQLRTYEDQIFVLAKQDLTVPVNIQWVSLNAPQHIINSDGSVDAQMLAPDEDYYLQVVADPTHVKFTKNYTRLEMPEYALLNVGLGIVDHDLNYFGHLDLCVALAAIQAYIADSFPIKSKYFDFKLRDISHPEISLHANSCLAGALKFVAIGLLIFCAIYMLIRYGFRLYKHCKQQTADLMYAKNQIEALTTNIALNKSAAHVQNKYGLLVADQTMKEPRLIYIHELLHDVHTVNAELAALRKVKLNLPQRDTERLHLIGNSVRLMQILSGILCEIINQLPANSSVTLQVEIKDIQPKMQKFTFKFIDDGFYNSLQDRQELQSAADIRAKGWKNIFQLAELEGATLEHTHTAYSGNIICFSVTQEIVNNVINLESYLAEG